MDVLDSNEFAVLELVLIARRLARRGLVRFQDGRWHPTAEGLNWQGGRCTEPL